MYIFCLSTPSGSITLSCVTAKMSFPQIFSTSVRSPPRLSIGVMMSHLDQMPFKLTRGFLTRNSCFSEQEGSNQIDRIKAETVCSPPIISLFSGLRLRTTCPTICNLCPCQLLCTVYPFLPCNM